MIENLKEPRTIAPDEWNGCDVEAKKSDGDQKTSRVSFPLISYFFFLLHPDPVYNIAG